MKKILFLLFNFFSAGVALFGQQDETLFGKSGLRLTGAWGGTVTGITSFDEETGVLTGGFGALEFNKTVLIGFSSLETSESVEFNNGNIGSFDLDFGGFMMGFMPRSHQVIHPKFSFLMGGGEVKVKGEGNDNVFIVQPSAGAEINVFRWFRVGLEGGYRFVSGADFDGLTDGDLSAFSLEMKLRFGWSWGR